MCCAGRGHDGCARAGHAVTRYLDDTFAVDVQTDVVFGTALAADGTPVSLVLDLYTPRGDVATNRPVFVRAHGGAFFAGDKSSSKDWAIKLAKRGYATASINYRLAVNVRHHQQRSRRYADRGAVFRANAASLQIDPDRIAVGGTSAGAVTALGVAVNADAPGQIRATLAVVPFAAGGGSCLYNQVPTHLVADLQGYFQSGAFDDVPDQRLLDTRTGSRPGNGSQTEIRGVPNRTGVVSIVATETTRAGYVQVLPCGSTPGATSNLNIDAPSQTRAVLAFVRFDTPGEACIYSQSATNVAVDVQSYLDVMAFSDITDVRLLDNRTR
ncbi:MAG: alpha/beta hydrolase [Actinomycetota bacterium]